MTIADLTPHTWSAAEHTAARVALQCAIQGNFARMEEHLRSLPRAALIDLRYALDVMHPMVRLLPMTREMAEQAPHEHQYAGDGLCACERPTVLPTHVTGWAIDGRAK